MIEKGLLVFSIAPYTLYSYLSSNSSIATNVAYNFCASYSVLCIVSWLLFYIVLYRVVTLSPWAIEKSKSKLYKRKRSTTIAIAELEF